ncbi:MAG: hypothetical protein J6D00_02770, partial [Christensenellaceae bacterium]|nr:hypothetical protein [Christensenellaceae bacterium]
MNKKRVWIKPCSFFCCKGDVCGKLYNLGSPYWEIKYFLRKNLMYFLRKNLPYCFAKLGRRMRLRGLFHQETLYVQSAETFTIFQHTNQKVRRTECRKIYYIPTHKPGSIFVILKESFPPVCGKRKYFRKFGVRSAEIFTIFQQNYLGSFNRYAKHIAQAVSAKVKTSGSSAYGVPKLLLYSNTQTRKYFRDFEEIFSARMRKKKILQEVRRT